LVSWPVITPEDELMTAVSTFWWAASFNSLEYESVLTFLWAKSGE